MDLSAFRDLRQHFASLGLDRDPVISQLLSSPSPTRLLGALQLALCRNLLPQDEVERWRKRLGLRPTDFLTTALNPKFREALSWEGKETLASLGSGVYRF